MGLDPDGRQERTSQGRTIDARVLRRLFLDLVGRPPYAEERAAWTGKERLDLIEWALASEEFWRNWLEEQLYYFLLIDSFRPTTEAVQTIPAMLVDGRIDFDEALHKICLSASFDRRNPGPDTFVSVVMEQLLGMTVQKSARELEIGKKAYDGSKATFLGQPASSQADVVHIAVADARFPRHFIRREFERWMRREPPEQTLSDWVDVLKNERAGYRSLIRTWFSSQFYDTRLETNAPQPNRIFIRALFVDVFGRLPDDDETRRVSNALDGLADSGPLRSLVARLMLDSGRAPVPDKAAITDPAGWIQGLFERLLGRLPGEEEQRVFLEAFRDPACRPTTILYAIVSHPEYQIW
jgi:hypothetical protein